jgi:D-threo-aldose 1-dehydrogenase
MDGLYASSIDRSNMFATRSLPAAAALGFGCAGLYGLPSARDRQAMLETAYGFGIRHFDVAPTYGLGLAERELSDFLRVHTDVTVATKFGMRPSPFGRLAGVTQQPVRRGLNRFPKVQAKIRGNPRPSGRGLIDRLLYTERDYSVDSARRSLMASLHTLRVDHIDYFLVHEPAGRRVDHRDVVGYLEQARRDGLIGCWGPAGDLSRLDADLAYLSDRAGAHQYPYDLIHGFAGPAPRPRTVTYGFIGTTLPRVEQLLAGAPALRSYCSDLLDADLADRRTVIRLLTRDALLKNPTGTVLASTTKPGNLLLLCEAAATSMRDESRVAGMLRQECRS